MLDSVSSSQPQLSPTPGRSQDARRFRLGFKPVSNEVKLYERYFHRGLAKKISYVQFGLALTVLALQLTTLGLSFGPMGTSLGLGSKTAGIWPSIITSVAAGSTYWATMKPSYFKLHSAMAFHIVGFLAHLHMEYELLDNIIPSLQSRIYQIEILNERGRSQGHGQALEMQPATMNYMVYKKDASMPVYTYNPDTQSEFDRTVASLIFSIIICLGGIFQAILSLFMSLKTGRAICVGRTQLEGKCVQVEAVSRGMERGLDFQDAVRNNVSNENKSEEEPPRLERSDALPPPPYESGYFHPSLIA